MTPRTRTLGTLGTLATLGALFTLGTLATGAAFASVAARTAPASLPDALRPAPATPAHETATAPVWLHTDCGGETPGYCWVSFLASGDTVTILCPSHMAATLDTGAHAYATLARDPNCQDTTGYAFGTDHGHLVGMATHPYGTLAYARDAWARMAHEAALHMAHTPDATRDALRVTLAAVRAAMAGATA